jgi:hypothetical protein
MIMSKRDPFPPQLRLRLPSDSPVPLVEATRREIVQLLAQLLASAVDDRPAASLPEASDEAR